MFVSSLHVWRESAWEAGNQKSKSKSALLSVYCQRVRVQWCMGQRRGGGRDGRELSFLTAWCMKLSFSLLVLAWRLRSLLPDGSRLNKLCDGWVESPAMQRALRVRRVLYMSWREGRETPTIFSAALTIRWRVLLQDALQAPYHT